MEDPADGERVGCLEESRGAGDGQDDPSVPSYTEAFPPLPCASPSPRGPEIPYAWGRFRPSKHAVMTQVFHLPFSETKVKEEMQSAEERAKVFQEMMRRSGARLEVSLAKDRGLSVLVTGTREAVMRARREMVTRLQTQVVVTVSVPKEHHGFLIGRSGQQLRDLELLTSTRIAVPPPEDPSCAVTVSGTKDGTERARQEILLLSAARDQATVERVRVEKAFHPFLQGPGGRTLTALQEETGARVHVPPASVAQEEVLVVGDRASVTAAASRVLEIYQERKQTTKTIAVEVRKSQHRHVVGPRGRSLQDIFEQTGVSVEVPGPGSLSETLVLRGDLDQLGLALAMVYARANSIALQEVSAPSWLHRRLIGKQGENISQLTQSYPQVHIEFVEGEDRVTLEGPVQEVTLARAELQDAVDKLVKEMSRVELSVPSKHYQHLIGRNGTNISRIRETYRVTVQFPEEGVSDGVICIEGGPEDVRGAEADLRETIQRLESEMVKDLVVDQQHHRLLIGPRGERIKEVRQKFPQVVIQFPDAAEKSDIIRLRGPRTEVQKCAKFLERQASELVESNYCLTVSIPKVYHGGIVGRGGSNIRKIREETHTRIELPPEGETVLIRGRKEDCEVARDRIRAVAQAAFPGGVATRAPTRQRSPLDPGAGLPAESGAPRGLEDEEPAVREQMCVDIKHHPHFLGRRGQVLREMADAYGGARVTFPRAGSGSDVVTLRGPRGRVAAARKHIEEVVRGLESQVTRQCRIPQKYHGLLMGPRGTRVQQLSQEHGVQIKFPDRIAGRAGGARDAAGSGGDESRETEAQPDVITIVGSEQGCSAVEAVLKSLAPVSVAVDVPFELHRFIIGLGGANIRKMMEEYDVSLTVPPPDQRLDTVTVTGRGECVERARDALTQKVRLIQTQQEDRALRNFRLSLSVDPKFHPRIIGRRGAVVSRIRREHDVQVQFPPRTADHPDLITITGYERNALEARSAIAEMVRGFEELSEREVALDPRIHSRIVGARGRQIRKIMEDYNVEVQMPPLEEREKGLVTVRGTSEAVDEAVDHLLNLQEEYVADLLAPPSEVETPPSVVAADAGVGGRGAAPGFRVRDAPWDRTGQTPPDVNSVEEFPGFSPPLALPPSNVWARRRF